MQSTNFLQTIDYNAYQV